MATDLFERHQVIRLEGGPVAVHEAGAESAPPVLLLHGAMYDESRFIWRHLVPALKPWRRVVAIDFPRHGGSRPWSGNVGSDCLTAVVEAVVEQLGLPPLPIVGLSMGGAVAILYGLRHPDRVTAGVFLGPGGLGDRVANQFLSWLFVKTPGALWSLSWYYGRQTKDQMKRLVCQMVEGQLDDAEMDELTEVLCEEAKLKHTNRERAMDDWQLEGLAPFRLRFNLLPELHRLSFPTLWLRGQNDPLVGQAVMEQAASLAPCGTLRVVEHAGHLLPLDQPEEVNRLITEFLRRNGV
jgi:pimeloyl-ACP methyl ester carboxylesterase